MSLVEAVSIAKRNNVPFRMRRDASSSFWYWIEHGDIVLGTIVNGKRHVHEQWPYFGPGEVLARDWIVGKPTRRTP